MFQFGNFQFVKSISTLYNKNNDTIYHFRNIQCRYFLRYTKQNIFLYMIISYTEFDLFNFSGPEGSRTPVRKPIPCSSTIIVDCLTFPPVHGNQHPCTFSSFIIRPASQSFDTVVSYMFEAWVLKCRCFKSDCCN